MKYTVITLLVLLTALNVNTQTSEIVTKCINNGNAFVDSVKTYINDKKYFSTKRLKAMTNTLLDAAKVCNEAKKAGGQAYTCVLEEGDLASTFDRARKALKTFNIFKFKSLFNELQQKLEKAKAVCLN